MGALSEELRLGRGGPSRKSRFLYPATSLWQSRYGLRKADHIFCKNNEDKNYLVSRFNLPPQKITRISPGAETLFASAASNRSYDKVERLLFAGTWIKRKGTPDVISAFIDLAERYPILQLTILGAGAHKSEILQDFPEKLHPRINIRNADDEQATAAEFAGADIYLLPSLFEGTPLTLMEAMMSGLPIVTTAACGMLDTIRDGENGILVPIRSKESIIEAVSSLIEEQGLRERLGRTAQADALRQFTWEKVAAPVREVYERLCASF